MLLHKTLMGYIFVQDYQETKYQSFMEICLQTDATTVTGLISFELYLKFHKKRYIELGYSFCHTV